MSDARLVCPSCPQGWIVGPTTTRKGLTAALRAHQQQTDHFAKVDAEAAAGAVLEALNASPQAEPEPALPGDIEVAE